MPWYFFWSAAGTQPADGCTAEVCAAADQRTISAVSSSARMVRLILIPSLGIPKRGASPLVSWEFGPWALGVGRWVSGVATGSRFVTFPRDERAYLFEGA